MTVTNAGYVETLREDARAGGESNWSMTRHARPGDRLLLYAKAPVQGIVAEAFVGSTPVLDEDPSSEWRGQYFADVYGLTVFRTFLPRLEMRSRFYSWRYWKQPRQSVLVPEEFADELLELIGRYR